MTEIVLLLWLGETELGREVSAALLRAVREVAPDK